MSKRDQGLFLEDILEAVKNLSDEIKEDHPEVGLMNDLLTVKRIKTEAGGSG